MTLKLCSLAARGLWIEMMAIMGISEKIGYLQIGGKVIDNKQLAVLCGVSESEIAICMKELEDNCVFSRDENGVPFNRRMVREYEDYQTSITNGSLGGNPALIEESRIKNKEARSQKLEARERITGGLTPEKTWKNDYETYKKECKSACEVLIKDTQWMSQMQRYYPRIDINLSIEKALNTYWLTEEAWNHKKRGKSKNINWKTTLTNALSMKLNQVWKPFSEEITTPTKKGLSPEDSYKRDLNECYLQILNAMSSQRFDGESVSRCLHALNDKYDKKTVSEAYKIAKKERGEPCA